MYKHFVFDIDGTLIDTEKTGVLSLIQTVRELLGKELPYDEAYKYFGIPSCKVGPMMNCPDPVRFAEVWEEHFVEMQYLMKTFDGVADMLAAIRSAGRKIGCVTSRSRYEFEKDPHLAALVPLFDHIVCAEDSVRHKPFPDPMLAYMRKASEASGTEVLPSECIYLGDTMHDCCCGHDAGCDFALADWYNRGMGSIPAQYRFTSAEEVLELLQVS